VAKLLGVVRGPKYDGVFLHDKIKSLTHDVRVADTVTNVIVLAFDVKYLQSAPTRPRPTRSRTRTSPTSASARRPRRPTSRRTSSRPATARAGRGSTTSSTEASRPTTPPWSPCPCSPRRCSAATRTSTPGSRPSTGTTSSSPSSPGQPSWPRSNTAPQCAKWGLIQWLYKGGFTPIIDIFSHASADMVDIHAAVLFEALHCQKNYLRIQVVGFLMCTCSTFSCYLRTKKKNKLCVRTCM
jgi:hypothetical protein